MTRQRNPNARTRKLTVMLDRQELDWLRELAESRGLTMSDWVRQMVRKSANQPTLFNEAGPRKSDDPMGYTG